MQDVKQDPDLMTDDDDDDDMEDLDALAKGMDRDQNAPLPKAASAADTTKHTGTSCCIKHECMHLTTASKFTHTAESYICLFLCWQAASSTSRWAACVSHCLHSSLLLTDA